MKEHLRRFFLVYLVLLILTGAAVYYFWRHWSPFTQNAFLIANTCAVTPLVSGYVTAIHVRNNQFVQKGTPLVTIYREPYRQKVLQLQEQIHAEESSLLALEFRIRAAKADLRGAEAEQKNAVYLAERADLMFEKGAVSEKYTEEQLRTMETRTARTEAASLAVTILQHEYLAQLSRIKALKAALRLAEIDYEQTILYAEADGYVVNMTLLPGSFCRAGEPMFGFVAQSPWFVQANFKESELSGIRPGTQAEIWLWQYPGKTFHGVVEHDGWSTERRLSSSSGLPMVRKENEWFLLPQRYPVQIRILDPDPDYPFHAGGSAYVKLNIPSRIFRQFFWQLFLWD